MKIIEKSKFIIIKLSIFYYNRTNCPLAQTKIKQCFNDGGNKNLFYSVNLGDS